MNVSRFRRQNHLGVAPSPAPRKGVRKGVYVVPSLFTSLNILGGFYSIMATMSGFSLLERGAIAEATVRFDHAAIAMENASSAQILSPSRSCNRTASAMSITAPNARR